MQKVQRLSVRCPFTIFVDTAECHPYRFAGIADDAAKDYALIITKTVKANLGRHPDSFGDYSLEGGVGKCCIERKSKQDAWGTLLGWPTGWESDRGIPGRRERFEKELANLNGVDCSLIVVEASLSDCLETCPQWGVKPAETNAKIFYRTVISYQQRFRNVQWHFCDTRRLAEVTTFRWMYRYWRKNLKPQGRRRNAFDQI